MGGKTGSICHFAFSLVLQRLGVQRQPHAGKNSHCHTPFCVPQIIAKTRIWEQCPHMLTGKARGK